MTEAAHAVYAPSSADRWIECTASATACAHLPEQEEGEEAAEGTAAHEEIERCLGPLGDAENGVGGGDFLALADSVDPEHPAAFGVALVIDYVRKLVTVTPGRLWIERRIRLTDEIWGRCDVCHYDPVGQVVTIVDYKNGYVPVDAEGNGQLQIYAAGSIYTHNLPVKWIRLVVVQPNDFRPVPRVKQHVMTAADLHAFASRVAAIPNGPLTFRAGEHCRYCPLFGKCEPTRDVLARLATMLCLSPNQIRPEQWAEFEAVRKPVDDWFKNAEKLQLKRALAGSPPSGMFVAEAKTNRAWIDEAAARAAVLERFGVDALKPPTPAQAEEMGLDVSKLATKPQGAPVLAREGDKRKPFTRPSAVEMFAGVVP